MLSKNPPWRRPAIRPNPTPNTVSIDQCHDGKFHGDRKCLCQNFTDRSSGERRAEVQREDALQVLQVLHDEGVVEVVARAQLLLRPPGVSALSPAERGDRITGQQEHHARR